MAALKTGPRSLGDFCCWPETLLQNLLRADDGNDGERLHRLLGNLQTGLVLYSDYSCLSGEHEASHNCLRHSPDMRRLLPILQTIRHSRFCDYGAVQCKVLREISALHQREICVMTDLSDRLPAEARMLMDEMILTEKVSKSEAMQAHKALFTYLRENREGLYPLHATSKCQAQGFRQGFGGLLRGSGKTFEKAQVSGAT